MKVAEEEDIEPTEPLEGALVPEKGQEIDGDAHRLFRCRASILYRDTLASLVEKLNLYGTSERPAWNGVLDFENPVPVFADSQNDSLRALRGFASLVWEGDRLEAQLTIPYSSPERLVIETQSVWAETTFRAGPEGVRLMSLFFSYRRPVDDRETPLRPVESQ
jgi:hypothetical protein